VRDCIGIGERSAGESVSVSLVSVALIVIGAVLGSNTGRAGERLLAVLWRLRRAPARAPDEPKLTRRQLQVIPRLWGLMLCVCGILGLLIGIGALS
jgi:hypothetical protein